MKILIGVTMSIIVIDISFHFACGLHDNCSHTLDLITTKLCKYFYLSSRLYAEKCIMKATTCNKNATNI